jgi:hypothetical protein
MKHVGLITNCVDKNIILTLVHLLVLFFELKNCVVNVVVVVAVTKFKTDVQLNSFHYKCMEMYSVHYNTKWKKKL